MFNKKLVIAMLLSSSPCFLSAAEVSHFETGESSPGGSSSSIVSVDSSYSIVPDDRSETSEPSLLRNKKDTVRSYASEFIPDEYEYITTSLSEVPPHMLTREFVDQVHSLVRKDMRPYDISRVISSLSRVPSEICMPTFLSYVNSLAGTYEEAYISSIIESLSRVPSVDWLGFVDGVKDLIPLPAKDGYRTSSIIIGLSHVPSDRRTSAFIAQIKKLIKPNIKEYHISVVIGGHSRVLSADFPYFIAQVNDQVDKLTTTSETYGNDISWIIHGLSGVPSGELSKFMQLVKLSKELDKNLHEPSTIYSLSNEIFLFSHNTLDEKLASVNERLRRERVRRASSAS